MKRISSVIRIMVGALSLAVVLTAAGAVEARAQNVKVGFVDFDEIIGKLPEFKTIQGQLETLQTAYQDTLRQIQTEYQTLLDAYQKQQSLMNAETKAAEEQKIVGVRDQFLKFQQERLGQGGTYFQIQAQLLQPMREKVRLAIERIAKSEKLTLVLESSSTVYFDEKSDITFKVLDHLKRGTN